MVDTFHILHCLVIVVIVGRSEGKVGNLVLNINFLTLQQNIDNLAELQVAGAEPAWITIGVLALGLHPEKVSLGARGELQDKDATVRSVLARRLVRSEASI
jgi:hypothetical protein